MSLLYTCIYMYAKHWWFEVLNEAQIHIFFIKHRVHSFLQNVMLVFDKDDIILQLCYSHSRNLNCQLVVRPQQILPSFCSHIASVLWYLGFARHNEKQLYGINVFHYAWRILDTTVQMLYGNRHRQHGHRRDTYSTMRWS